MFVCMYTYIYIHIYIYIYTHTASKKIYMFIYTLISWCSLPGLCIRKVRSTTCMNRMLIIQCSTRMWGVQVFFVHMRIIHVCIYVCVYICTMYVCACIAGAAFVRNKIHNMCVCIYAYMCVYTHTHVKLSTYIHGILVHMILLCFWTNASYVERMLLMSHHVYQMFVRLSL